MKKKINQWACYNRIWSWSPMPCEKHGPRASVTTKTSAFGLGFCLLSPSGHVFHTAWETMIKSYRTRARAKQEVKSRGRSPRDLTYCSHKPECIGTTNPDRSVLITIITWHFQFHPLNVSNLHVKGAYVLEVRAVSRAPPFVTSRGAP